MLLAMLRMQTVRLVIALCRVGVVWQTLSVRVTNESL